MVKGVKRRSGWPLAVLGVLLVAFGLGCVNYTRADKLEHHQEMAARHGWPPPGKAVLTWGVVSLVVGSGLVGAVIGRASVRGGA